MDVVARGHFGQHAADVLVKVKIDPAGQVSHQHVDNEQRAPTLTTAASISATCAFVRGRTFGLPSSSR